MHATLPFVKTIQKVRAEGKADRKMLADQAFQRRLKARLLLFGKGRGKSKNLPMKERLFIQGVWRECYRAYLLEFHTGKSDRGYQPCSKKYRRVTRSTAQPMNHWKHRRRWYGSQKARWIRHDVPNMMSQRFELETSDG